jgi:signal transduction histidine kinase
VALYPLGGLVESNPADTTGPRLQVDSASDGARRALGQLKEDSAYAGEAAPAEQLWSAIAASITRERALLASDEQAAADSIRRTLEDQFGQMEPLLDGIEQAINAQTDRLGRLVHRLLDVSRFEAGGARLELREIDLHAFFDDLTSDFRVLAVQNGIDFPVRLADDLPPRILGDEDRLSEVLGNLLSNAFKFTGSGGTIRVDAARHDGGIQVEVEDTGVGIAPEKLPRIFEKFYQVENDAQPRSVGSGLGLAIAREIVEAHGGTIGAESQEGKGTRFRVFLPERPPAQRPS